MAWKRRRRGESAGVGRVWERDLGVEIGEAHRHHHGAVSVKAFGRKRR